MGCLVSFEDYPVAPADGATGGAGATAPDSSWPTGGTSGIGGASGSGGSGGGGGSAGDGSAAAGGSGSTGGTAPTDAAPDQTAFACQVEGFWSQPAQPTAPSFVIYYENAQPLACVAFRVTCGGSEAAVSGMDAGACASKQYCWATSVTNCPPGPALVEFIHEKDLNGQGDCNAFFPGSPGSVVASCAFEVAVP